MSASASSAFGNVRRRNGKFQIRYRVNGRETSQTAATREEAEAIRRNLSDLGADGRRAQWLGRTVPLARAAQLWALDQGHAERSLRTAESHLRAHILPAFGNTPLASLRRCDIEAFVRELPTAPITRRRTLGVMTSICTFAVDHGWIDTDPTSGVKVPGAHRRRSLALPTIEQVETLGTCIDARFVALVDLMAYGGCSISEASALRVEDLDFEAQLLRVRAAVDVTPSGARVRSDRMKTPTRDREVPVVPSHVWERLECHRDRGPQELVTPSPQGKLVHPSNFRTRVFRPAVERTLGPSSCLTPHDLRHFALSLWAAAGASDYEVADWAGHTGPGMVRRIYGHALPRTDSVLERSTLANILSQRHRPRLGNGASA